MKITGLKTYTAFFNWRNWLFVRLYTDEGITGVGEATLAGKAKTVETAIHELGRYIVGKDPFGIERHWEAMYKGPNQWRGGPILNSAISGIEAALWDIIGKRLGVPIYKLLGGPYRERVRVYANAWFNVYGGPDGSPEAERMAELAALTVAKGYNAIKVDPFGPRGRWREGECIRQAVKKMQKIREAIGDEVDILVECSEAFTPRGAIIVAKELEPFNPFWLEEPVAFENIDAMRKVAELSKVPIATGERLFTRFQFRELLEQQVADIIQPDLTHVGGILECKKVAAMAETWYVKVAPHNSGGPISHAMSLQLAACIPNFLILETFINEVEIRRETTVVPIEMEDGYMKIPDGPGLGTDIIDDVIEKYPYKPVEWDFVRTFVD